MSLAVLAAEPVDTVDPVEAELLAIAREHTKSEGLGWTAATTLEEANIDSFDTVELVFAIEDKFGIDVDFNANAETGATMTFGQVADMIRAGLAAKAKRR